MPEPKNEQSPAERAAIDIAKIRKDAEALKKALVESYGDDDKLTQDDRDLLSQVDVATSNKIVDRLENL